MQQHGSRGSAHARRRQEDAQLRAIRRLRGELFFLFFFEKRERKTNRFFGCRLLCILATFDQGQAEHPGPQPEDPERGGESGARPGAVVLDGCRGQAAAGRAHHARDAAQRRHQGFCLKNSSSIHRSRKTKLLFLFVFFFNVDLDVDGRQAGDGHVHRQELEAGVARPGHLLVQPGAEPRRGARRDQQLSPQGGHRTRDTRRVARGGAQVLRAGVHRDRAQLSGGGRVPLLADAEGPGRLLAEEVRQGSHMRHRRRRQRRQHDPGGPCGRRHSGQGGRAGLARRRLLHHPVQPRGASHTRPRTQQLQALRLAQPIRHASRHDHIHHTGHILLGLLLRLHSALSGRPHGRVRSFVDECLVNYINSTVVPGIYKTMVL